MVRGRQLRNFPKHVIHEEAVGRRMATDEGRAIYRLRAPVVEGVFAEIKHGMGIRRFLLRGLKKVRLEWDWICGAFNLRLLLRLLRTSTSEPVGRAPRKARHSKRSGVQETFNPAKIEAQHVTGRLREAWEKLKTWTRRWAPMSGHQRNLLRWAT